MSLTVIGPTLRGNYIWIGCYRISIVQNLQVEIIGFTWETAGYARYAWGWLSFSHRGWGQSCEESTVIRKMFSSLTP